MWPPLICIFGGKNTLIVIYRANCYIPCNYKLCKCNEKINKLTIIGFPFSSAVTKPNQRSSPPAVCAEILISEHSYVFKTCPSYSFPFLPHSLLSSLSECVCVCVCFHPSLPKTTSTPLFTFLSRGMQGHSWPRAVSFFRGSPLQSNCLYLPFH